MSQINTSLWFSSAIFFHTPSAFVFTVGLNLLWSMLLFPSSLRNTTFVFFWDAFLSIFLPCFSFFCWQPHWQDVLFQIQKSISCHHRRCDKMSVSAGVHFVEGIGVKKMWPPCSTTLVVSFFFSQWGLCSHQIKLHKYSHTTWNVNLKAVWKLNVCAFMSTCFLPVWFTPALPQQRLMTASPDHQQPITTQSGSSTLVFSSCRIFSL